MSVRESHNSSSPGSPALSLRNVTKEFPGVLAVDDVSVTFQPGQITALLGQNGAGKSTLIGVMAGLFGDDFGGEIEISGVAFSPDDVTTAEAAGIVLIAQEINVVPEFTVAQMLMLHREPTRFGIVDRVQLEYEANRILTELGLDIPAGERMGNLGLAHQQLVMIARALSTKAAVLILDEPTAALTAYEAERLFDRLRSYRDRGTSCLFVSHRLAEVFALADRILVMRDGSLVGDHATHDVTRQEIVAEMLGHEHQTSAGDADEARPRSEHVRFQVDGLTVHDPGGGRAVVRDASFKVRSGEIVGLFGLVGSGAGQLAAATFGGWRGPVTGTIEVDGSQVSIDSPEAAVAHGIGFVAQDRRDALIGDQTVTANVVMASLPRFSPHQAFDHASARSEARNRIAQLDIKTRSDQSPVRQLSGGNQQKVQVAKWLTADTPILVLDDPNRGVDVGAGTEILRILRQLADDGRALLLVSSEARELIEVCDRILVMVEGRVVAEFDAASVGETDLITAAAGFDRTGEVA